VGCSAVVLQVGQSRRREGRRFGATRDVVSCGGDCAAAVLAGRCGARVADAMGCAGGDLRCAAVYKTGAAAGEGWGDWVA